jgi:predicted XRE-type DNA-binding protein
MLAQPGAWDTDNPQLRAGIEPRVAAAVRIQQRLARQLVAYRQTNRLTKSELADRLHMSRAQLWRLVDGHAPITLLHACAWAELLGTELVPTRPGSSLE